MQFIENQLKLNCYPKQYVLSIINSTLDNILEQSQKVDTNQNQNKFMDEVKA